MERQDARVNTEEGTPTQHLNVPVFEVERVVGGYSSGIGGEPYVRDVCSREVGQRGDADGWRLCVWRSGVRFCPWGGG